MDVTHPRDHLEVAVGLVEPERAQRLHPEGEGDLSRRVAPGVGLLLLAPVLTSALDENRDEAIRAGAAIVLDSGIPPLDKLGVAQDVLTEVDRANGVGKLPDVGRALADRPHDDDWNALRAGLQDQLDRAVTSAFSRPFFLASALTLCALLPLGALWLRRRA